MSKKLIAEIRLQRVFAVLAAGLISACAIKPTETTTGSTQTGLFVDSSFVVVDTREPLQFQTAHVPGSVNIRWQDFSQKEEGVTGLLEGDLFYSARRLALMGIAPSTPVLVLGESSRGKGEEGRVAWMLKYLGIEKVKVGDIKDYRLQNPRVDERGPENRPVWRPFTEDQYYVDLKTFQNQVFQNQKVLKIGKSRGGNPEVNINLVLPASKLVLLDVRSKEEFESDNLLRRGAKISVINKVWTDFFDSKGQPKAAVKAELSALGVNQDTVILVMSQHGVRSGAVTYALSELGYVEPRNFAGGFDYFKAVSDKKQQDIEALTKIPGAEKESRSKKKKKRKSR